MFLLSDVCIVIATQVLTKSSTGKDPDGWYRANVKMVKGGFLVVDYLGWESTYSEIVSTDRVRPVNRK